MEEILIIVIEEYALAKKPVPHGHPYRAVPNSRFAIRRTSLSDPDASFIAGDGQACEVMGRMVGVGDRPTMLNMPLLESSSA